MGRECSTGWVGDGGCGRCGAYRGRKQRSNGARVSEPLLHPSHESQPTDPEVAGIASLRTAASPVCSACSAKANAEERP